MNELQKAITASATGELYTDNDLFLRRYLFTPDFPGFSGHFPGYPIVPAIVQILTVISLAREETSLPLRLESVEDAKFLTPIRPDQEILVQYKRRQTGGKTLYDARLTVADKTAASFLIHLEPEEETE